MRKKYQKKIIEKCTEAITFARVSSEKQERGASIDAQKELIYDYCMEKNLKIIKEFEITESTTRGDRVKYNEMLDFIRSRNKKTAIVVNCVDRLQRSDEDNPALNKLRREGKIEIHFMKEHIILDETSPVQDIFAWKMNVLMAGNYTDSLSYNVKRSLVKNWNSGKWQGMAPLGYLNRHTDDDNNEAIIIVDPVRGPIIKHLFEEFATGLHSLQSLWYKARELGLTSKEKNHYEKSKNFNKRTFVSRNKIEDILKNPFYYGMMKIKGQLIPHIETLKKNVQKNMEEEAIMNANLKRNLQSELNALVNKEDNLTDLYVSGKIKENIYNRQINAIADERTFLEESIAKYKEITKDITTTVDNLLDIAGSLSDVMHHASPLKKNKLLKLLIKDCRLHDKELKYTIRAPFDKFIQCNNPTQWFKDPTSDIETYTNIADEVKMVKQQVLLTC